MAKASDVEGIRLARCLIDLIPPTRQYLIKLTKTKMKIVKGLKQVNDHQFIPIDKIKLEAIDIIFIPMLLAVMIGGLIN